MTLHHSGRANKNPVTKVNRPTIRDQPHVSLEPNTFADRDPFTGVGKRLNHRARQGFEVASNFDGTPNELDVSINPAAGPNAGRAKISYMTQASD
ncbi:hypothetical protein [Nostocoides sp. F2B08]|uniref:hypothetical protein n=1 Tax=Nostocoides sp. F2B08 TaxID=2653936 RepID=UPI001D056D5D|nr:hypothetical protein [Tetrasphaera sp. F2B08]